ncbi:transporter [Pseudomonas sp. JZ134]|uniref:transporter n=1 Tax=Pseudomonas sp. JZ134 TaxID=2806615 RepID=UPI003DA08A1C
MDQSLLSGVQYSDLSGILYGFIFRPGEPGEQIDTLRVTETLERLEERDEFVWLHLNLAHAACKRWMMTHLNLPDYFFEILSEGSRSTRLEHVDATLLAVVNDVVLNFGQASYDVATLYVCANRRMLISVRHQPLRSVDRLRAAVKKGEGFRSPLELLIHLLRDQEEVLTQIVRETNLSVDRIEDRLLSTRLADNRAELGNMRRTLVRIQRLLALEPNSLMRLLNRPPRFLMEEDVRELRAATDEFSLVISDLAVLIERIKLIQEEIAAQINEQTSRTLFTLTLVTVLALPINIVAGFFGMNVGGIPLADAPHGFWILVILVASFTLLAGRWAFRKRNDY